MSNNPNDNHVIVVAPTRRDSTPTISAPPLAAAVTPTPTKKFTATSTPSPPTVISTPTPTSEKQPLAESSLPPLSPNLVTTVTVQQPVLKTVASLATKKKEGDKENDRESGISISSTTSNETDNMTHKKKHQQHMSRAKRSKLMAIDKKAEKEREREKLRERQSQKEHEREQEREKLKLKEAEKEQQKEKERAREREKEKDKQENEKVKDREKRERDKRYKEQQEKEALEKAEREKEFERLKELEREKQKQLEKQRELEQKEREKRKEVEQMQKELEKQRELEQQREKERERLKEIEYQKELEVKRQKEQMEQRQRELELEKERKKALEREKRQKEREKDFLERKKQKELERKNAKEAERKRAKEKAQALRLEVEQAKLLQAQKEEENMKLEKSKKAQHVNNKKQNEKEEKLVEAVADAEDKSPPTNGNNIKEVTRKYGKTPGRERRKEAEHETEAQSPLEARKFRSKVVQALVFDEQGNTYATVGKFNGNQTSSGSESASPSCIRSPWEAGSQVSLGDLIQPRQLFAQEMRELELSELNPIEDKEKIANELGPIGSRKSPSSTPLWESVQKQQQQQQQNADNLQFPKPVINSNSSFFSNLPATNSPNLNTFGLGDGQFMGLPANLFELQKVQMELQRQLQTNEFIINLHQQQQRLQQQQELLEGTGEIATAATVTMANGNQWPTNNAITAWSPMGYRPAVGLNIVGNNNNQQQQQQQQPQCLNTSGNNNININSNEMNLRLNAMSNNTNATNLPPWQQLGLSRPPPGLNASPNHMQQGRQAQLQVAHFPTAPTHQHSQQQANVQTRHQHHLQQQQQQHQQQHRQQNEAEIAQFDPFKSLSSIWSDTWNKNGRNGNGN